MLGSRAELIQMYPILGSMNAGSSKWVVWFNGRSSGEFWKQFDDFGLPRDRRFQLGGLSNLESGPSLWKWLSAHLFWSRQAIRGQLTGTDDHKTPCDDIAIVCGRGPIALAASLVAKRLGIRTIHILETENSEEGTTFTKWLHRALEKISDTSIHLKSAPGNLAASEAQSALRLPRPQQLPSEAYVVCQVQERENLENSKCWSSIVRACLKSTETYPLIFLFSAATRARLEADPVARQKLLRAGVVLQDVSAYSEYVHLISTAKYVITDKISTQKIAAAMGIPCLWIGSMTNTPGRMGSTCMVEKAEFSEIETFLKNVERYRQAPLPSIESPATHALRTTLRDIFGEATPNF